MSILAAYEEGGIPIISPDKLYKKGRKIADVAVACFTKKALDYVLSAYRHETYNEFMATGKQADPSRIGKVTGKGAPT